MRRLFTATCLALAIVLGFLPPVAAQPSSPEVTLELIMGDPDWIGNPPENPYWSDDGRSIFYSQKQPGLEQRDLVQISLTGEVLRRVALTDLGSADQAGGSFTRDRGRKVYEREGDLFVKVIGTGDLKQLTRTAGKEGAPLFLTDGVSVAFFRGNDLFVRNLTTGLEAQVAELRLEKDPATKDEPFDYLKEQQERLIDFVREAKEKADRARERELAERRADPTRLPPPYYLGEGVEIRQTSLSPSGTWLLLVLGRKDEKTGKRDMMPNYVTASGYVEPREVRSKVGTGERASESLLLIDLVRGTQHPLALEGLPGISDDPLKELREKAEAARKAKKESAASGGEVTAEDLPLEAEAPPAAAAAATNPALAVTAEGGAPEPAEPPPAEPAKPGPPRAVTFFEPVWSEDGRGVALRIYSLDNKDRWIATIDFENKALRTIHHRRDEAWLGWDFDEVGFLPQGDRLWYLSEESGFSHLYLADLGPVPEGAEIPRRQLTAGEFLVSDVAATHDGASFFFRANREHPGIYEVYRVAVDSGQVEQLTKLGGLNDYRLSPDERSMLIVHSSLREPPELYLQRTEPGVAAERLTHTVSPVFEAIDWALPEIVAVPSTHASRPIYSRLYVPREPAAGPRPAVFFVHGAGYLQNAHQGWSTYFREFMFHTLLTRRGYVVLDMDYRASAGYGRDWRTAIYRQMGTPELEDLEDGVAYVVANHGVDRERIGVYGGSYGGFMTLMALFKRPDLFACGAALRPVTDWAHYNHGYTSAILNTPTVDPEAYAQSSPIEFADGLDRPLLLCAPMQDDNVFFQDTVRLAQRLIELGKENWEVAIFPVEPHGFREPSSWLDEYRRILKLMETHLRR